jgi:hypothetical protein
MVKHTLFLVHGMGRHEGTQWSDEVWEKLVECSERYPHFRTKKKLAEYAEPVPVGYDEFLRAALRRWDEQATTFGAFAQTNDLRHADSLDWLAGVSGDGAGFLLSHVADVVIYRFFAHEAGRIQDVLKERIFSEVARKQALDADAKFSVMAHSLGTSVVHDALAEMGGLEHIDGDVNTFSAAHFRFDSIHLLANVSRLLQTKPKAYASVVRPGPRSTAGRYCGKMYCHRHELDPFLKPKPFEPVTWGRDFELANLRHYRGWNVHGWLHYLDHPMVHVPLLKSITKSSAVTPKQEREAVGDYPRFGADLQNVAAAQAKLAELQALAQDVDEEQDLKGNFDALMGMWSALKDLRDLTGASWQALEGSVA